jgi:hypothetical protein
MNCTQCDQPTAGKSKYCITHRAEARAAFKEMLDTKAEQATERYAKYQEWITACSELANTAYLNAQPAPMAVYETAGLSDAPKPGGQSWYVSEGVCGFAWVTISPATSSFARWLSKNKIGYKAYKGGWQIPMHFFVGQIGQSLERAEAASLACSRFLREQGIKAHASSRMD